LSVGGGKQFIVSPLQNGLIYWAADVTLPEGENELLTDKKGFLLKSFAGWHSPITELIDRTDEADLVIADVFDSVPKALTRGRMAALGDAAHPMTPDLGQGACQGIEDGVLMAACMAQDVSPTEAFHNYEMARLPRVRSMVRESRYVGALATSKSAVVSAVRDGAVSHMPAWLNSRMVARYASESSFLKTLPVDAVIGI
jgi:2-polyprenyl-6-methoxyphenol hydroxylase-like FAD-dependent oxidoreductase